MRIEKNEDIEAKTEDTVVEAKTAKCPECGGKYLPETGYCPKCKKKVGGKKEDVETEEEVVAEETPAEETPIEEEAEIIEIPEEVKLTQEDGSTIVLEKGDKIQIVKEDSEPEEAEPEENKE